MEARGVLVRLPRDLLLALSERLAPGSAARLAALAPAALDLRAEELWCSADGARGEARAALSLDALSLDALRGLSGVGAPLSGRVAWGGGRAGGGAGLRAELSAPLPPLAALLAGALDSHPAPARAHPLAAAARAVEGGALSLRLAVAPGAPPSASLELRDVRLGAPLSPRPVEGLQLLARLEGLEADPRALARRWARLRDDLRALARPRAADEARAAPAAPAAAPAAPPAARLSLSVGGEERLDWDLELWLSAREATARLSAHPAPCQRAFDALPPSARGPLTAARLTGTFSPTFTLRYTPSAPELARVSLSAARLTRRCRFESARLALPHNELGARVQVRGKPADLRDVTWLNEPFSFEVDAAFTEGRRVRVGPGEEGAFVPLRELPAYVGGAMYLTEEMGFWRGGAVSVPLIERALNTNLKGERFVYGGSTVTQQLVKNLFLTRDKVLTRKLHEALIAARVLDAVSKERLLELYLNCIEFAPGVWGVQAAARHYFQKDARALSPREATFLAMLKVSPSQGRAIVARGRSPSYDWWRRRSVEVFERLVAKGLLTPQQAAGQAPFELLWGAGGAYLGSAALER
ncbi:MAG: hypothetical protein FJ138_01120 [Deltaproteobacteria bacterium]|nr:hypothetical protein [Deltaproteobacteria bacterium]